MEQLEKNFPLAASVLAVLTLGWRGIKVFNDYVKGEADKRVGDREKLEVELDAKLEAAVAPLRERISHLETSLADMKSVMIGAAFDLVAGSRTPAEIAERLRVAAAGLSPLKSERSDGS